MTEIRTRLQHYRLNMTLNFVSQVHRTEWKCMRKQTRVDNIHNTQIDIESTDSEHEKRSLFFSIAPYKSLTI